LRPRHWRGLFDARWLRLQSVAMPLDLQIV
jgi:hypothetical protein